MKMKFAQTALAAAAAILLAASAGAAPAPAPAPSAPKVQQPAPQAQKQAAPNKDEEQKKALLSYADVKEQINRLASQLTTDSDLYLNDPAKHEEELKRLHGVLSSYYMPLESRIDPSDPKKRRTDALMSALSTYLSTQNFKISVMGTLSLMLSEQLGKKTHRLEQIRDILNSSDMKKATARLYDFPTGIKLLVNNAKDFEMGKEFPNVRDPKNPTASEILKMSGLQEHVTPGMAISPRFMKELHVFDNLAPNCSPKQLKDLQARFTVVNTQFHQMMNADKIAKAKVVKMSGYADIEPLVRAVGSVQLGLGSCLMRAEDIKNDDTHAFKISPIDGFWDNIAQVSPIVTGRAAYMRTASKAMDKVRIHFGNMSHRNAKNAGFLPLQKK